jgi:hypothetical protein
MPQIKHVNGSKTGSQMLFKLKLAHDDDDEDDDDEKDTDGDAGVSSLDDGSTARSVILEARRNSSMRRICARG